jgi:hypothetical protein
MKTDKVIIIMLTFGLLIIGLIQAVVAIVALTK